MDSTNYVYVIGHEDLPVKVGMSKNPQRRCDAFRAHWPYPLRVLHAAPMDDAKSVEAGAHFLLHEHRQHGEWFNVSAERAISAIHEAAERIASGWKPPFRIDPKRIQALKEAYAAAKLSGASIGRPDRIPPALLEFARADWLNSGMTNEEIASAYGVTPMTMWRKFGGRKKAQGRPPPDRKPRKKMGAPGIPGRRPSITPEQWEWIGEQLRNSVPVTVIMRDPKLAALGWEIKPVPHRASVYEYRALMQAGAPYPAEWEKYVERHRDSSEVSDVSPGSPPNLRPKHE
ncbi:GIY-YIG nuclease family protein [Thalassobaculum litoreum]|uniref:GIY-YIG nuclease family protein n=1 Tax=Thalassobaculum litoreum TaxID=420996 RepID=UPI000B817003|nr:GIY-YIG nuclease family protein [Thalassobaculum litoreum]